MDLEVIIPFFNESTRIDRHIAILKSYLNEHSIHLIYVDDGSTDHTSVTLEKKLKDLKHRYENLNFQIIQNPKNTGKGGAVKLGVTQVTKKYCLYTDFDFSIDPFQIPQFLKIALDSKEPVLVIASRAEESEVIKKQTFLRRFLGRSFNKIMKLIISLPHQDTQCGFKLIETGIAKEIFSELKITGFAFDVELLKRAQLKNIKVIEKGVKITNDDENSTVNVFLDPFKMMYELIKLRMRLLLDK